MNLHQGICRGQCYSPWSVNRVDLPSPACYRACVRADGRAGKHALANNDVIVGRSEVWLQRVNPQARVTYSTIEPFTVNLVALESAAYFTPMQVVHKIFTGKISSSSEVLLKVISEKQCNVGSEYHNRVCENRAYELKRKKKLLYHHEKFWNDTILFIFDCGLTNTFFLE